MTRDAQKKARVIHVFTNILSQNSGQPELPPEVPSRRWMYWQMTCAVAKKVSRAPFSLHTYAALRRTILSNFLPDNLATRYKAYQKGECNRCGLCCKIQFECPFFVEEGPYNTHCKIYTSPYAPNACLRFPLDPLDLQLLQREIGHACTFYFEGKPQRLSVFEFVKLYTQGVRQQLAKRKLKEAPDTLD
jgi:hypothetical protein